MILASISLLILGIFVIIGLAKLIFIIVGMIGGVTYCWYKDKKEPKMLSENKRFQWCKCKIIEHEIKYTLHDCGYHIFKNDGYKKCSFSNELGLYPLFLNDCYTSEIYLLFDDVYYSDYKEYKYLPDNPKKISYDINGFDELNLMYDNTIKEALNLKYEDARRNNPSLSYDEWEYAYYLNVRILISEAIDLGLSSGWKWHFDYRTYPPYRHHRYSQINYREYAIYNLGWLMEQYGKVMEFYGFIPEDTDIKKLEGLYKEIKKKMGMQTL